MFCKSCGQKLKESSKFCPNCGQPFSSGLSIRKSIYYSKDWEKVKFFSTSSPYYDVLVDGEYFYLIYLPSYSNAAIGTVVGFFVLNILGAAIGWAIGNSSDAKKRNIFRSKWVDSNYYIISNEYESRVFIKIPVSQFRNQVSYKKKKFTLTFNGEKYTYKNTPQAMKRLSAYLITV